MCEVNILGVQIDCENLEGVLGKIRSTIQTGGRLLITNVNIHALLIADQQEWFRNFLNASDLVFCDGMGVQLGARLLKRNIPSRFTLADWIWSLAELSAKNGFSLFFLGNPPGVAEKAAARLLERFEGLNILGCHHGFFNKDRLHEANLEVVRRINACQPNILLVGMGMPTQEKWLEENWHSLNVNVAITCGALFEYVAGDLPRGPRWMTDHYLEWLARIILSPRRYLKRYMIDIPSFTYKILRQRFSCDA